MKTFGIAAMKRISLVVLLPALGCYAYVPAVPGRSLTDREVQLSLTDSGAVVMAPLVGPSIATVDGRFIRSETHSKTPSHCPCGISTQPTDSNFP